MKPNKVKSVTEKIVTGMMVALVVIGSIAFMTFSHISDGQEFMSKLFIVFIGIIITLQIVPSMILLGAMIKGVVDLGQKPKAAVATDSEKTAQK